MARTRIRTIKPELFRHRKLFDLEMETGLPIRAAWMGLFTAADREGRFRWEPHELKLDILPYDEIDFSRVLDALATRGFIVKYTKETRYGSISEMREYGWIPTFNEHQVVNNREGASKLPDPNDGCEIIDYSYRNSTQISRETHASPTPHVPATGEMELEMEGEMELEMEFTEGSVEKPVTSENHVSPSKLIWKAYSEAYCIRYEQEPIRNAKINAQIKQLVSRLPTKDAPEVARFFVQHNNRYYVQKMHPVGLLLQDAEKLYTEWRRGRPMTAAEASSNENADHYRSQLQRLTGGGT